MNEQEQRAMILDFERNRQLLASVSSQKQQIALQLEMIDASLEEMGKTKEKMVYKVVGNVLFPKDTKEMEKELKEKREVVDLKLKTAEKQEETLLKKLNVLRSKLESEMKEQGDKTESADKKKKN